MNFFGKWKTTFQIVGIALMLYREPFLRRHLSHRRGVLYVAAALTLWSMIEYLRAAWPAMRGAADPGSQR